MRIGLMSPEGRDGDAASNCWTKSGDLEDLSLVAEVADSMGFHHLAWPAETSEQDPLDPAVTLAYLAARTQQIRFVLPVPAYCAGEVLRQPERTLSHALRGRFIAATLGGGSRVVPMEQWWVNGAERASLQLAIAEADGWQVDQPLAEEFVQLLAGTVLPAGFEVVVATRWADPIGEPEVTRHMVREAWASGATLCTVRLSSVSADHHCEQLGALHELLAVDGEV